MPDSIKCDKCDQEFTDEEAHKIHMNIDHGASEADSFQFIDSRNAVDEQEFVEDNGVRGYNPNPNAGLYDNKLFRNGSSTERTSQLGEANGDEEGTSDGAKKGWLTRKGSGMDSISDDLKQKIRQDAIANQDIYGLYDFDPEIHMDGDLLNELRSAGVSDDDIYDFTQTISTDPTKEGDFMKEQKKYYESKANEVKYQCPKCDMIFTDLEQFTDHQISVEGIDINDAWTNVGIQDKTFGNNEYGSGVYESKASEFSLKDYRENEEYNEHSENALQLVKKFGTPEEIKEMEEIVARHEQEGSINSADYNRRYEISQKYFPMLTNESYAGESEYEDAYKSMKSDLDTLKGLGDYNPKDSDDAKKVGMSWQQNEESYSREDVDYDKENEQTMGFIEQQHTEPKEDKDKELDGVDISLDKVEEFYPTKASEARKKSYTTEAKMIEGLEEEYDDFEDSDKEEIEETITLRKLGGYSEESIARELHITYGVSHDEALEKVYSVEVSNNDKVAQTFFGKMYKECTESEKAELRMYSGSE